MERFKSSLAVKMFAMVKCDDNIRRIRVKSRPGSEFRFPSDAYIEMMTELPMMPTETMDYRQSPLMTNDSVA